MTLRLPGQHTTCRLVLLARKLILELSDHLECQITSFVLHGIHSSWAVGALGQHLAQTNYHLGLRLLEVKSGTSFSEAVASHLCCSLFLKLASRYLTLAADLFVNQLALSARWKHPGRGSSSEDICKPPMNSRACWSASSVVARIVRRWARRTCSA